MTEQQTVRFDPELKQYTARSLAGHMVYADSRNECIRRLGEANRIHLEHASRNEEEER